MPRQHNKVCFNCRKGEKNMETPYSKGYKDGATAELPNTSPYIFDRQEYIQGYIDGSIARRKGDAVQLPLPLEGKSRW